MEALKSRAIASFVLGLVLAPLLLATEPVKSWSRFRGPNGDGISDETGLLKSWPEGGPQEVWRIPIGVGYSGITATNGRMFTMDARGAAEFLVCLNTEDGTELWRTKVGPIFEDGHGAGPRSTPTIDGNHVFALGASGNLLAANKETGAMKWTIDFNKDLSFNEPEYWWGFSGSPFIENNLLIMNVGGSGENKSIAAIDKSNGEVLWTTHSDLAAYSTPIAIEVHDRRQFIFVTANNVVSVSLQGQVNWKYPWLGGSLIKIAMPVFIPPDKIFVSASYDIGAVLLRIDSKGPSVQEVWKSKIMRNHFHSSIFVDGHIFGFDNATLKCIEPETGKQKWAKRRLGKGSLIYADGHFIVLSERGKLVLVEANPERYLEKGSVQVFKGKTWTSPTLSGGKLFLRNQKEIVCLNLKETSS